MPGKQQTRREFDRIRVQPMYTAVTASTGPQDSPVLRLGHVYDISESGVRIELDDALDPGETVSLHLDLPAPRARSRRRPAWSGSTTTRTIRARGVWR